MAISIRDNLNPIVQESLAMLVRNDVGQHGFTLTIDGKTVQAYENQTLLSVAVDNGITDIPNMCDDEKLEPTATCRMCLVHVEGMKQPLPSCTTPALPGMVVKTQSDELFHIRRTNLEMLLSDHNAYCQPPCQIDCPTHIDIPGYLELIAKGSMKEAARLVKEVLPFPYILCLAEKVEGKPVPVQEGREVVVLGGGFTTCDCTRTSLRLGAKVHTGYRRSIKEMTATMDEIEDSQAEGTELLFYVQQTKVIVEGGKAAGIEFIRNKLGEPDASGRRRPVPIPGTEFVIKCDTIIPAFGQNPDEAVLDEKSGVKWTKRGTIQTDPHNYMTDRYGVFAGGDAQMGAKTIIECVGQGKLGARSIHAFLNGEDMKEVARRLELEERKPDLFDIVPYKPVEPQVKVPWLPYEDRKRNFKLIELGYMQEQAKRESARCLQCACPAAGQCDLQKYSIEHGLADNRFHDGEPSDYHDYELDLSHSFILRDPNKCINCTQCVRVCHDVIGPDCYGMFGKGFDTIVSTPFNVSLHDTDCVSCGACVQVCPTGSLMMAERVVKRYAFALDRCIFCGDCVEVCPHGALGETPNFELSFFNR